MSDNRPSTDGKTPLCTCVDRGEPDWNGAHDEACPWLEWSGDRLSISELQRRYAEGGATQAVLNLAPVLLEIAAAALAWLGEPGVTRTDGELRTLCEALIRSLAKVRP